MPATTPKGYPYVLGTDNVADYPTTSQGLATALESMVPFRMAQGTASVPGGSSNSGSVAVTFPVGLFTVAPIVMVSKTTAQQKAIPNASSPTTTGVTIGYWTGDGTNTAGAVTASWLAIQLTTTSAGLLVLADDGTELVTYTLTCHTEGCDNSGVPIDLAVPVDCHDFLCGVCGEPITDALTTAQ